MLLKDKRIFYVEDNPKNLALVKLLLEEAGAKLVFDRWGGKETLTRLETFMPVDLILIDLMLPNNATGYEVFDAIRAQPEFTSIPIVATSAADPGLEMTKARLKGFAGYIAKPISILTFREDLKAILMGKPVWA